ncbi:hypothetical protein BX661DRAFT_184429 [Kickxella alabastrina]|uniref:uncharacterized protein n=1 Tax=Kickxella alabastrina TaxID=61397 RepID=UPI00222053E8|nr:uncharacterized protein BX661DRAFT_184429 [Kickxella alabastrina]KAI7825940.1 hypothetical protein BX661DRAFT_184429 [Kickxella alabastrina]
MLAPIRNVLRVLDFGVRCICNHTSWSMHYCDSCKSNSYQCTHCNSMFNTCNCK